MTLLEPQWLFAIIGPLFLVLGIARTFIVRRVVSQGLTWLILGVLLSAVAIWLWVVRGALPIA